MLKELKQLIEGKKGAKEVVKQSQGEIIRQQIQTIVDCVLHVTETSGTNVNEWTMLDLTMFMDTMQKSAEMGDQ